MKQPRREMQIHKLYLNTLYIKAESFWRRVTKTNYFLSKKKCKLNDKNGTAI